MVNDPVATAASNNPLLATLVAAVGAVNGLGDTLNSQEALTVFAPFEGAFAEIAARGAAGPARRGHEEGRQEHALHGAGQPRAR